jgi:hypothetical protein
MHLSRLQGVLLFSSLLQYYVNVHCARLILPVTSLICSQAATVKSGPMKALVSNKSNISPGTVGIGAGSPGIGAAGVYGMGGTGITGGMCSGSAGFGQHLGGQSMDGHMTSQIGGGFGGVNPMYGMGMGMGGQGIGTQMGGMGSQMSCAQGVGIGPSSQMGSIGMRGFQVGGPGGMGSAGVGTGGTNLGGWQGTPGTGGAGPAQTGGGFQSGNPFMP